MTKQAIRDAILTAAKPKKIVVEVFGISLEIRQPSLGDILSLQEFEDNKARMANMLVEYCFVPGTEERVFDVADVDTILGVPFGADIEKIQEAIGELTSIDVEGEKGN